jgi:hypothetical protein
LICEVSKKSQIDKGTGVAKIDQQCENNKEGWSKKTKRPKKKREKEKSKRVKK